MWIFSGQFLCEWAVHCAAGSSATEHRAGNMEGKNYQHSFFPGFLWATVFSIELATKRAAVTVFYQLLPVLVRLQNLTVLNMPSAFGFIIFLSHIDYCLGHTHKVNLAESKPHWQPQDEMSVSWLVVGWCRKHQRQSCILWSCILPTLSPDWEISTPVQSASWCFIGF